MTIFYNQLNRLTFFLQSKETEEGFKRLHQTMEYNKSRSGSDSKGQGSKYNVENLNERLLADDYQEDGNYEHS